MPIKYSHRRVRALIVDDDIDAGRSLAHLLATTGAQSVLATDSAAALEKAKLFSPHLIFLKLYLPGMNGFELATQLREASLPPYLLVALSEHRKAHAFCNPDDFHLFLGKPADSEILRHLVEVAGALRQPVALKNRA